MAKRKKITSSQDDTKITAIVVGLFAAIIILFLIFSKAKEPKKEVVRGHQPPIEVPVTRVKIKRFKSPPALPPKPQPFESIPGTGGRIAFIIDDWGQSTANCEFLKDIPEPLAVSILPGLRHTKEVAYCAKLYHKLVMLHLPMEAMHNNDYYPPDYIIKTTMNPDLVAKIVDDDLSQIPYIEGVNNHMGSKATEDKPLMKFVLKKIKKKKLFFVDSMTAHSSVCEGIAKDLGIAFGKRDVFLDNINTKEAIVGQIMVLAQKARRSGYAVAIGHDRRLTMQVLKEEIPLLENRGFEIVGIKSLLKTK